MNIKSKLTIHGKKTTITLDADRGGIWVWPNHQQPGRDGQQGLCLIADDLGNQFVGLYDGNGQNVAKNACDVALYVTPDGTSGIQYRDKSGALCQIDLADLPQEKKVAWIDNLEKVPEQKEEEE